MKNKFTKIKSNLKKSLLTTYKKQIKDLCHSELMNEYNKNNNINWNLLSTKNKILKNYNFKIKQRDIATHIINSHNCSGIKNNDQSQLILNIVLEYVENQCKLEFEEIWNELQKEQDKIISINKIPDINNEMDIC